MPLPKKSLLLLLPLLLAGCGREGQFTRAGIVTTRTACPAVAIPAGTGDITLFDPPSSRDARAIDVVAYVTNVRAACDDSGEYLLAGANFEVHGSRRDAEGAREVILPYFATVVHAGDRVVAKDVSRVALRFEPGQHRASTSAAASARILRSAATLPEEIRERITREREPGDPEAAIDPMSDPDVRAAVKRASFELLVGFQLTEDQLAYNVTR
ncbi:MAG: hypothetical protein ACFBQW_03365 [Sphingomonadaceae bacterium]